jgi:hypothetical protein
MSIVKGKLDHTEKNMERVLKLVRNKTFCCGLNEYGFVCYVDYETNKSQLWALVDHETHIIRNCGENILKQNYRSWSSFTGITTNFDSAKLALNYQLTMFQNFNTMRIYLTNYFQKTKDDDIGLLLSGLMLSNNFSDWRENSRTWDPPAWDDWMAGVNKTLKDLGLEQNSKKILYDEKMAFLCMKNYLQIFYKQFSFDGVGNILTQISAIEVSSNTQGWKDWLSCVQAAIDQESNIIA